MSYSASINRNNPMCCVILIDQSGSMNDPFGGSDDGRSKATKLADVMNRLLANIVIKCSKGEEIRDYFHIGVIGYGVQVAPALGGALAGQDIIPISQIAANPLRVEDRTRKISDGAGGLVEVTQKFPVWAEPVANGGTPMRHAFEATHRLLASWVATHSSSFPPVVINISDGEATDISEEAELFEIADAIKAFQTNDGKALLLNLHLSSNRSAQIEFPSTEDRLPDNYARTLYRMSSVLPDAMLHLAKDCGFAATPESRGFIFNANIEQVVDFLEIGTFTSSR